MVSLAQQILLCNKKKCVFWSRKGSRAEGTTPRYNGTKERTREEQELNADRVVMAVGEPFYLILLLRLTGSEFKRGAES